MSPGQLWWLVEAKIPSDFEDRSDDRAKVREMIRKAKEDAQDG